MWVRKVLSSLEGSSTLWRIQGPISLDQPWFTVLQMNHVDSEKRKHSILNLWVGQGTAANATSNWSSIFSWHPNFGWLPAVLLLDWMSESIVVIVWNAWRASVLAFKLEALDSSSDSLTLSLLVFCLLELAMGVQEGSSSKSCIMPNEINHDGWWMIIITMKRAQQRMVTVMTSNDYRIVNSQSQRIVRSEVRWTFKEC